MTLFWAFLLFILSLLLIEAMIKGIFSLKIHRRTKNAYNIYYILNTTNVQIICVLLFKVTYYCRDKSSWIEIYNACPCIEKNIVFFQITLMSDCVMDKISYKIGTTLSVFSMILTKIFYKHFWKIFTFFLYYTHVVIDIAIIDIPYLRKNVSKCKWRSFHIHFCTKVKPYN